jgi:hypothetical protein
MSARGFPVTLLAAYAALSVLDLVLTSLLLAYSGGRIYESNPIAQEWLTSYGWRGLVAFKVLASGMVAGTSVLISRYRPLLARLILALGCVVMVGVVLYSGRLLDLFLP